ncbi:hypothetical protein DY000_02046064 [Brassica cretica]|uniref:Uncharacterized protein n=1 Tax=Brassica cretica TaxID=69181 RepID=A0ABQ7F908_BRACR|nr:hypothetical protein DY000_02046064 [Brassica cretica]
MEPPELAPEPPHAVTTPSSSPPFATARNRWKTAMHSDKAVRASRGYADCECVVHAPTPEIVAAAVFRLRVAVLRRRPTARRRAPPSLPANFLVRHRRPPPSPLVTVAGDSVNSAESTQRVNSVDSVNRLVEWFGRFKLISVRLSKPVGYVKLISGQGLTFDQRVDFSANLDQFRFQPFERRSDPEFRSDFRFGVYLSSWSS